jgi:hypothetical protein
VRFLFEDLHNLLNHLWMPDTYFVNAKETQVSICKSLYDVKPKAQSERGAVCA